MSKKYFFVNIDRNTAKFQHERIKMIPDSKFIQLVINPGVEAIFLGDEVIFNGYNVGNMSITNDNDRKMLLGVDDHGVLELLEFSGD